MTWSQFDREWLNADESGNHMVDYSHMKVILLDQKFWKMPKIWMHFWKSWKKKSDVPRNTYLAVAEDAEAVLKLQKNMEESVGTYLEDYFENVSEIKNCLSDTRDALSGAGKQNGNPVYPLCGRSGPKACRDKVLCLETREAEGM